jgi:hypothetical protein
MTFTLYPRLNSLLQYKESNACKVLHGESVEVFATYRIVFASATCAINASINKNINFFIKIA